MHKNTSNKMLIWLLIISGALTLVLPWLLTMIAIWDSFGFDSSTGVIGDTIGGIVGPILNFTGLLLVYFSIKAQIKSNNLQEKSQQKSDDNNKYEKELHLFLIIFEHMKTILDSVKTSDIDNTFENDFNVENDKLLKTVLQNSLIKRISYGLGLAVQLARETRIKRFSNTSIFTQPMLLSYFDFQVRDLQDIIFKHSPKLSNYTYQSDNENRKALIHIGIVYSKIVARLDEISTFISDFRNEEVNPHMQRTESQTEQEAIIEDELIKIKGFKYLENISGGHYKPLYNFLQNFSNIESEKKNINNQKSTTV